MNDGRAVFPDLNGTLVTPVLVDRLQDLSLIDDVPDAVARLCRAGFVCPVVTVQSRIEKGYFTLAEFGAWFEDFANRLAAMGARLTGPYVCPHRFRTPCACAKPQTLLYERAAADHGLRLSGAFAVGDTVADMEAAQRFGGLGCLVRIGDEDQGPEGGRAQRLARYTGHTLGEVVDWILRQQAAQLQH